jgi:uncharacterized protein DUF4357
MPVRQTRSSTRGWPPLGEGSCSGNSGSTSAHRSSVTNNFGMASSVTGPGALPANAVPLRGLFRGSKGSWAARFQTKSMPVRYQALRRDLIEAGAIALDASGEFRFVTNCNFASPSEAACVVQGGSRNGYDEWKNAAGRSLKQLGWSRPIGRE